MSIFEGQYTFHCCNNLRRVYVGDGVKTVGGGAFYGDRNLEIISLPSRQVLTSKEIFDMEPNETMPLKTVVFRHGNAGYEHYSSLFSDIDEGCRFYVPKAAAKGFREKGYPNVIEM